MNIKIFDVDHGFRSAIEADDYRTVLIDSGYSFRNGFRPSWYFLNHRTRHLDYLIVPAYTEDPFKGFSDLMSHLLEHNFSIDYLMANPSIDVNSVPELAVRNPGTGKELRLLNKVYNGQTNVDQRIHLGDVTISFFCNQYPEFLNVHNLSLVTFLYARDVNIIFPGNLKTQGWHGLLRNPKFRDRLRQVNLFVASNHGQEDGYCPEVFNYCSPDLIIIPNHVHQPLGADRIRQYERHARGLWTTFGKQRVLTTGDARTITINQPPSESLQVITQKHKVYSIRINRNRYLNAPRITPDGHLYDRTSEC
ncbi:hypothetical protein QUB70_30810 [Microcoleus sp. A003_D6]|uniref:hypothetical protein n=1 Tax=Microcoleus sp. A003_D6 TaxID=3055266 RepID=UPI002FCF20EE